MGCGETLPPVSDYSKNGPFTATTVDNTGPDGGYTVVQPTTLGQNGFKHPVATWGNGITTTPSYYPTLLNRIASNGIVVIASNSSTVTADDMTGGLDWMIQQNAASGPYQGKLDTSCLVAIGYSLGGMGAVGAGAHANIVTTVSFHGLHGGIPGPQDSAAPLHEHDGHFRHPLGFVTPTYNASAVQTFYATLTDAGDPSDLGHLLVSRPHRSRVRAGHGLAALVGLRRSGRTGLLLGIQRASVPGARTGNARARSPLRHRSERLLAYSWGVHLILSVRASVLVAPFAPPSRVAEAMKPGPRTMPESRHMSGPAQHHSVPIALVSQLVHLRKRWQVPASRPSLLRRAPRESPGRPARTRPGGHDVRAPRASPDPDGRAGPRYYLGLQTRATLYGYLGFAMLSAATVGDALKSSSSSLLSSRRPSRSVCVSRARRVPFVRGARGPGLRSRHRPDQHYCRPERAGASHHGSRHRRLCRIRVPRARLLREVRASGALLAVRSTGHPDAVRLGRPGLPRPHGRSHRGAARADAMRARARRAGLRVRLADRVRRLVADRDDDFGSLERMAAHLGLSPRTLRRRLAGEGASFSVLVDHGRRDKALRLLRSSRLSIEDIARQIGYTSASSFARAVHRWTGKTPIQYRRAIGAP